MKLLRQNITNLLGKEGENWIANLPVLITELKTYWELEQLTPVANMTFSYVAKAVTRTHQPVILKISIDKSSVENEIQALSYFEGDGSIQLLAHDLTRHAMLLQQAIPGTTLKTLYPAQREYVIDCYIETMKKLHDKALPKDNKFSQISDWLRAIDSFAANSFPAQILKKAIDLKNELLASMSTEIFLHGDLHHNNILKHGNRWLAIDPKGVVGEPEFEIAAFDFLYINELAHMSDVKNILEARIHFLAQKANLNRQRIKDWVIVRLVLMAVWQAEDNIDSSAAINLAAALI